MKAATRSGKTQRVLGRYECLQSEKPEAEHLSSILRDQLPVLKKPGLVGQMVRAGLADPYHVIQSIRRYPKEEQSAILSTQNLMKGLAWDARAALSKLYDEQNKSAKAQILMSDTSPNGPFASMATRWDAEGTLKRFDEQESSVRKALVLGTPLKQLGGYSENVGGLYEKMTDRAIKIARTVMTIDERRDFLLLDSNIRTLAEYRPAMAMKLVSEQGLDSQYAIFTKTDAVFSLAYVAGRDGFADNVATLVAKQGAKRQQDILNIDNNSLTLSRHASRPMPVATSSVSPVSQL